MTLVLLIAMMLASAGEGSFVTARELYASAAYEDALKILDSLPANRTAEDIKATEQYRALCLLALGRAAEAETAIAAVIIRDPTYRPSSDVSPRVRTAFTDVRRKTMPAIVQQWYTQAKAQFDRKEFAAAASLFNQTLGLMADPDLQATAAQPPLSDLRTLASGFRDLAESALAAPPLPSLPTPAGDCQRRPGQVSQVDPDHRLTERAAERLTQADATGDSRLGFVGTKRIVHDDGLSIGDGFH